MRPARARALRFAGAIAVCIAIVTVLLFSTDAGARVGGGESFSTGGGGGGGDWGGGGGGDDGIGLILYLLIRLAIEYPALGVPLLVLFLIVLAIRAVARSQFGGRVVRRQRFEEVTPSAGGGPLVRSDPRHRKEDGVAALKQRDTGFSLPVLHEFLQLVHRRSMEAIGTQEWAPLAPYVAASAQTGISGAFKGVRSVSAVVYGGIRVEKASRDRSRDHLAVFFLGGRLERLEKEERRVYFEERWHFSRDAGAISPAPEDMLRLGCPSCGAAVETDRMGRCVHCETPISKGQLSWQATQVELLVRRRVEPPKVGLLQGGDEPSVGQPSFFDPNLGSEFRNFKARHPDFDSGVFAARAAAIFHALQKAWSDGAWEKARPYVTEPMYQNLRFTMEQYAASGLRNKLEDIALERQEIVKVELDAWYEAITIRLWARMKDYVADGEGKVVGGNANVSRRFSEYWTFLRAAGTGAASKDASLCPSCGAPLDQVSQAGVCGYCDTRITSGRFDWVLSRIDQTEVYQG